MGPPGGPGPWAAAYIIYMNLVILEKLVLRMSFNLIYFIVLWE